MEEKVVNILKEIGLGKIEIEVYIDLLKNRVSSATEISKRTHQHRSNVYDSLKRLQQKGFITEVINHNKKLFEAKQPTMLFSYLEQKKSELREILPLLEDLSRKSKEAETVSVSYGLTRLRAILYNVMNSNEEVILWGVPSKIEDFLGEAFMQSMVKLRIKQKKKVKILYNTDSGLVRQSALKPYHDVRFSNNIDQNAMVIIISDFVFFVLFSNPVMIIEIKGNEVSQWYSSQFNFIWLKSVRPIMLKQKVVKKTTTFRKKFKKSLQKLRNGIKN